MAYPIKSPFDQRITRLRGRLQRAPGDGPHKGIKNRLLALRARRESYYGKHQPPSPVPFDAASESAIGAANRDLADTQTNLAAQRYSTQTQYGFDAGFQGDPFSVARLLQQHYDQGQRGAVNSYAAAGHLYSGALSNAEDTNRQSYLQNYDTQKRAYTDQLNRLSQQGIDAQRRHDEAIDSAKAAAIENALKTPPDPSEAPPPSPVIGRYRKYLQRQMKGARKHHNTARVQRIRKRIKSL